MRNDTILQHRETGIYNDPYDSSSNTQLFEGEILTTQNNEVITAYSEIPIAIDKK